MSVDFTAATRSPEQLQQVLDRPKNEAEMILKLSLIWAKTFNLPPNDARLYSVSLREAVEQIRGMTVLESQNAPKPLGEGPLLTGTDPEWDALELAEHDPSNQVG